MHLSTCKNYYIYIYIYIHTHTHTQIKGIFHPTMGHENPEGKQIYRFTFSLTSALDGSGWYNSTPRPHCSWEKDPVPIV